MKWSSSSRPANSTGPKDGCFLAAPKFHYFQGLGEAWLMSLAVFAALANGFVRILPDRS